MSARRLFPHQEDLVEQVLNGDPMPVVLRAPAGAGVDSVLVALCRDAVRSGAEERILSVVATRAQAEQFVALIEDELGAGIAAPITSKTFRFFLDEGDQSARVFVITASLVLRDDVLPALQQIGWSVVIGRGSFDTRYRSTRAILSLAPRRGLLFVDTGSRLAGDPSSPEHRVVDWHALSREQLGLYPEREVLVIEFRRTDEEIAALMRLDEMLRDWPGLVSDELVRRHMLSTAVSSPLAFESLLLRALRGSSELTQSADDEEEVHQVDRSWRPPRSAVEQLIDQIDASPDDRKLARFIDLVLKRLTAGERVVTFCLFLATASYLHESLVEVAGASAVLRLDGSLTWDDRNSALERWRTGGGVLIATLGASADLDLSAADLAVAYDPIAGSGGLERIWGSIDRIGRDTPPTLALLNPDERSRIALEAALIRDET